MTGTPTLWRRIKIFQADLNIRLSLRYGDPTAWHWWLAVKLKILRNYPFASQRKSKLLLIVLPTGDELFLHVYREDNSSFCIYLYVIWLSPPSLDSPMRSIIWYYSSTCIYWRIFQLKSSKNFIVIIASHSRNWSKSGLNSPRSSIFTRLSGSVLRPLRQPPWMAHGYHYSETIFTPKYCIQKRATWIIYK